MVLTHRNIIRAHRIPKLPYLQDHVRDGEERAVRPHPERPRLAAAVAEGELRIQMLELNMPLSLFPVISDFRTLGIETKSIRSCGPIYIEGPATTV